MYRVLWRCRLDVAEHIGKFVLGVMPQARFLKGYLPAIDCPLCRKDQGGRRGFPQLRRPFFRAFSSEACPKILWDLIRGWDTGSREENA
jgi:hypothetical protein